MPLQSKVNEIITEKIQDSSDQTLLNGRHEAEFCRELRPRAAAVAQVRHNAGQHVNLKMMDSMRRRY